jgi:hypothetical protein
VAHEHVLIGRADSQDFGLIIFDEGGIFGAGNVTERVLLPEFAMEAQRAAGLPAVAGVVEFPFARDQNGEATPGYECVRILRGIESRGRVGEEVGRVVVVVIELLEDVPFGGLDADVHFRSDLCFLGKADVADVWDTSAEFFYRLFAVIDYD